MKNEFIETPPELSGTANMASLNLLPSKSTKQYDIPKL